MSRFGLFSRPPKPRTRPGVVLRPQGVSKQTRPPNPKRLPFAHRLFVYTCTWRTCRCSWFFIRGRLFLHGHARQSSESVAQKQRLPSLRNLGSLQSRIRPKRDLSCHSRHLINDRPIHWRRDGLPFGAGNIQPRLLGNQSL